MPTDMDTTDVVVLVDGMHKCHVRKSDLAATIQRLKDAGRSISVLDGDKPLHKTPAPERVDAPVARPVYAPIRGGRKAK